MITQRAGRNLAGLFGAVALLAGQAAVAGDEIVAAGKRYHTGTPVVLWTDPGGYDAYRVERPSPEPTGKDTPPTPRDFGRRTFGLATEEEITKFQVHGLDLEILGTAVDQFVIHYDVAGTSRRCFRVLQERGLSVHFLLDLDGTVYQTLDLKEAAWHATIANGRSVGVEIANVGAYPVGGSDPFRDWYTKGGDGRTRITIPGGPDRGGQREPSADLRPDRDEPVVGEVQGRTLRQYDLTPQQYAALVKLTATLCTLFPRIACDYPRDGSGRLVTARLPGNAYQGYHGLLGHYHVQADKTDPGPAFQWDKVVAGAKALMAK